MTDDFVPASEFDPNKHTQKISADEEQVKLSLRKRFHLWLCDHLGVVPADDFDELFVLLDRLNAVVYKNMEIMTRFHKVQADFDKRVAERLHLDHNIDMDNYERGMYR